MLLRHIRLTQNPLSNAPSSMEWPSSLNSSLALSHHNYIAIIDIIVAGSRSFALNPPESSGLTMAFVCIFLSVTGADHSVLPRDQALVLHSSLELRVLAHTESLVSETVLCLQEQILCCDGHFCSSTLPYFPERNKEGKKRKGVKSQKAAFKCQCDHQRGKGMRPQGREQRKVTAARDSNTRWPQAQIKNSADRSFTLTLWFYFFF